MAKLNVLITGAAAALAHKLGHKLRAEASIFFADSVGLPSVAFKSGRFVQIPDASSLAFAHQLLTICLDHEIHRVFPLRKSEIQALSEARLLFDEYNIRVMVPPLDDLNRYVGHAKTGELIVKGYSANEQGPARGAFFKTIGLMPEIQLVTVD